MIRMDAVPRVIVCSSDGLFSVTELQLPSSVEELFFSNGGSQTKPQPNHITSSKARVLFEVDRYRTIPGDTPLCMTRPLMLFSRQRSGFHFFRSLLDQHPKSRYLPLFFFLFYRDATEKQLVCAQDGFRTVLWQCVGSPSAVWRYTQEKSSVDP